MLDWTKGEGLQSLVTSSVVSKAKQKEVGRQIPSGCKEQVGSWRADRLLSQQ